MGKLKAPHLVYFILCFSISSVRAQITYNISDFGAIADIKRDQRISIQAAIDKANTNGGGIVIIPPGEYLIGGIQLKDNVTLSIHAGAVLYGSEDLSVYANDESFDTHGNSITRKYLISILNAKNVTIEGKGTVDGQGLNYWEDQPELPHWIKAKKERPNALLEVANSENVTIRDITLTNSPHWTCHILHSKNVKIDGINILNSLYAPNADGIDITGSQDVLVSNCNITTCDDAVVLKTWKNGQKCEDIAVTNCTIETLCAALKLGTESYADYNRITFSNCVVKAASRLFAIYVRDGCTVDGVTVSNIVGSTKAPLVLNRPIQIMITKRNEDSELGHIRNVFIDQIICRTDGRLLITADDGASIDNLSISKIHLDYPFVEDPAAVGKDIKSGQFPLTQPHLIQKEAAVVVKNLKNFQLKDLTINWPGSEVPKDWQIPVRLINGDFDLKFKHNYSLAKQTEMNVLYGEKLEGGLLENPLANSSDTHVMKYKLEGSSIQIKE